MSYRYAIVRKFCDGSYDVRCGECQRTLFFDLPFDLAEEAADVHNAMLHPTLFQQPT